MILVGLDLLDSPGQVFVCSENLSKSDEARTIRTLIRTARVLFSTAESIATPGSVNA